MSKVSKFAATVAVLPVLAFSAPVFAGSPGQLGGGNSLEAKNVTTGSAYSDTTTATCNDTVQFSMVLGNTQWGSLSNVTLKVSLPSQGGVSTATATTDLGGNSGTTDTTSVTLTSGATQSLVNGTTTLSDGSGHVLKTLPDTITTTGVNVGTILGSTTEVVHFQSKVKCETQPKTIQVCRLSDKTVVTINESDFDSAKYTKDLTQCQTTPPTTPPTTLVNTGAGSVAGIAAAVAAVSGVAYSVVMRRRAARQ